MKIACSPSSLKDGLAIAGRAVNTRATLPVLGNIHLATDGDNRIALSATDLEIGIRTWFTPGFFGEPGAITVPARTFTDLVSTLPNEQLTLALNDNATLHLSCGRTQANVKGIPAQEFVGIPDYEELLRQQSLPAINIEPHDLEQALTRTTFSAATDDSRPILTAVYVHSDDGHLAFASADGFRLSVQRAGILANDLPDLLIPRKAAAEAARLVAGESEPVRIVVNDTTTQVAFLFSNAHLVTQLIDGRFPDYNAIIPTTHAVKAAISMADLRRALKATIIFARDNVFISTWKIEDGKLTISGVSAESGDQTSELQADVEGEIPFEINLNAKYVTELLQALGSQTARVVLECTTPSSPVLIRDLDDDAYTHVIMPMHSGR